MAGFSRVKGSDRGFEKLDISSEAMAIGDVEAFDRSNAVVTAATSSTTPEDLAGVVVEAATTSDTQVLMQRIMDGDEYIVDTANNSSASHNYQRMLLTDENTVNNTGSDNTTDAAVFVQLAPVGAASDKKIRGRFITRQDRSA